MGSVCQAKEGVCFELAFSLFSIEDDFTKSISNFFYIQRNAGEEEIVEKAKGKANGMVTEIFTIS